MERRRVQFRGRVQGVGFRATARAVARDRPVTGWVRNEPDGSVVMEIQGDQAEIDRCLEALRTRMKAFIRDEAAAPATAEERESGFVILH